MNREDFEEMWGDYPPDFPKRRPNWGCLAVLGFGVLFWVLVGLVIWSGAR